MRNMTIILLLVVLSGCASSQPDDRVDELLRSQRISGTNEFHNGWNSALDNIQHHIRSREKQ